MSLAAIIMNLTPVTPPPPPAAAPPLITGGDPWWDRDRDDSEFLREVATLRGETRELEYDDTCEEAFAILVAASELQVEIRATFLNVQIVEAGNLIHFFAPFKGPPDEVFFSYMIPGSKRPIVDPGFGQPGSRITQLTPIDGGALYAYTIDSTGFRGGVLCWHFWGTGQFQASEYGDETNDKGVKIPDHAPQLL